MHLSLFIAVGLLSLWPSIFGAMGEAVAADMSDQPGFSFDCDLTPERPCRKLEAVHQGKGIPIEPSSAAWSPRHNKAIIVSDNFNDLVELGVAQYAMAFFDLESDSLTILVKPLLTPDQAKKLALYDLEGVTVANDKLYAIGSLALHGKDPDRDRWERHKFVRMDLKEENGELRVEKSTPVSKRWADFREWLISESGHEWSDDEIRGRAEGKGINVEALSVTSGGTIILGFRGPTTSDGGTLAMEIEVPPSPTDEPILVKEHVIPPLDLPHIPQGTPRTLRGMFESPGRPGEFYILLGPKGYEKETIFLAKWDSRTGRLSKGTELPAGFVAEGIAPISNNKILIVDDLNGKIMIATEN